MSVAERYAALRAQLADEARAAGRDPRDVAILAVSKFHPAQAIREAAACGITDVGENYAQEAAAKFGNLSDAPQLVKHFIGHVQTNKAKSIAGAFDVVQSIDRIEAGEALAAAAQRLGKRLRVLVQVNVSPTGRFGCAPDEAPALAGCLRSHESLFVDGVMVIGPMNAGPAALEDAFGRAAVAFRLVGGNTLSMGMSEDWPAAVRAGSTMIRLGTALFGPRHPRSMSKDATRTSSARER